MYTIVFRNENRHSYYSSLNDKFDLDDHPEGQLFKPSCRGQVFAWLKAITAGYPVEQSKPNLVYSQFLQQVTMNNWETIKSHSLNWKQYHHQNLKIAGLSLLDAFEGYTSNIGFLYDLIISTKGCFYLYVHILKLSGDYFTHAIGIAYLYNQGRYAIFDPNQGCILVAESNLYHVLCDLLTYGRLIIEENAILKPLHSGEYILMRVNQIVPDLLTLGIDAELQGILNQLNGDLT